MSGQVDTSGTFTTNLFKYHYPRMAAVVEMLHSVDCGVVNPLYKEPAVSLSRALVLAKVMQVMSQHRTSEQHTVSRIIQIISYFTEKFMKFTTNSEIKNILEKILYYIEENGNVGLERFIDNCLGKIYHLKYPEMAETFEWREMDPLSEWIARALLDSETSARTRAYLAFQYGTEQVPSMATLMMIARKLLNGEPSDSGRYPEEKFNLYFNEIALWTAALQVYNRAIYAGIIEENCQFVTGLITIELRNFFAWLLTGNGEWIENQELLEYLMYVANGLSGKSSEIEAVELYTIILNLRGQLMKRF